MGAQKLFSMLKRDIDAQLFKVFLFVVGEVALC